MFTLAAPATAWGYSIPICSSWPKYISLELTPFTCKPFIVFCSGSLIILVMLSQVCDVSRSPFHFNLLRMINFLPYYLFKFFNFPNFAIPPLSTKPLEKYQLFNHVDALIPTQNRNFRSSSLTTRLTGQCWNKQSITWELKLREHSFCIPFLSNCREALLYDAHLHFL